MFKIVKLKNTVQHYPWGTTDYIPALLGVENKDNAPYAELWMGDHPRGPSMVVTDSGKLSLREYIHQSPEEILGEKTAAVYGESLPFLFKVLSAADPLSIQAHPDKEQAEEGFLRENRAGISLDAYNRNYRDNNHKPEIICALTPFTAMCGFKKREEIDALFSKTGSRVYAEYLRKFLISENPSALRSFFRAYMELEPSVLTVLLKEILKSIEGENNLESRLIADFFKRNGTDPGVLAPLYLNVFELKPGEALFQGPGELHAYVKGTGIELMANSDNVLRGGMTSKNIDKEELLKILSCSEGRPSVLKGVPELPCVSRYETPVEEFLLRRILLDKGCSVSFENSSSAQIFLSISGKGTLLSGGQSVPFSKGESFFLPASLPPCTVQGFGECFIASTAGLK